MKLKDLRPILSCPFVCRTKSGELFHYDHVDTKGLWYVYSDEGEPKYTNETLEELTVDHIEAAKWHLIVFLDI